MGNGADLITFGIALVVFAITLIVAKLGRSFMRYNDKTRAIAANMRHAKDQQEYLYWRRELLWHYLHLIPCMTKTGMNKLCAMFRKGKHHDDTRRSDGLAHILAPSVAGLCICALTLCGVSYAWFTATVSSGAGTIQAAQYGVNVTITEAENPGATVTVNKNAQNVTADLAQGKAYKVTLKATGTATQGYCTVELKSDANAAQPDSCYYTMQLVSGDNDTMTFTINTDKAYTLKITPQWGTCSFTEDKKSLKNGDTIETQPKDGQTSEGSKTTNGDAAGLTSAKAPDNEASGSDTNIAAPVNSDTPTAGTSKTEADQTGDTSSTENGSTDNSTDNSTAENSATENSAVTSDTIESNEPSVSEPNNDSSAPTVTDPQQQN